MAPPAARGEGVILGPQHRLAGAAAGAGYATFVGAPYVVVVATALIATVSAGGPLSPDLDQSRWWRSIPHWRGMKHRGVMHWFGWPVLAWVFGVPALPASLTVVGAALTIGWASHIAADLLFGRVPLTPWGAAPFGLKLDTGGLVETLFVRLALIVTLLWFLCWRPLTGLLAVWN